MHIGMIYGENRSYPADIRVDKEIATLAAAGFRVTVLAKKLPSETEGRQRLVPRDASVVKTQVRDGGFGPGRLLDSLTGVRRPWLGPIERFVTDEKPDALHVHDFPMVPVSLAVAARHGIPLVADLHENMPAAFRAYRSGRRPVSRLASAVFANYRVMRLHEKRFLPGCRKVIVVVPEAAERLLADGLPEDRIVVVSNTEDEETARFLDATPDPAVLAKYAGRWAAVYTGGVGPHRGLDTALRAIPHVRGRIPNFLLLIVGASKEEGEKIEAMASAIGVRDAVEVVPWQPFAMLSSYLKAGSVCLVPHNDFEHTHTTVPHKLFQYMISSKPVIVSDCRPLARIVGESGAGLIFEADNAMSLADRLVEVKNDPAAAAEMGRRGRAAALGPHSWRHDAARLVKIYNDIGNTGVTA